MPHKSMQTLAANRVPDLDGLVSCGCDSEDDRCLSDGLRAGGCLKKLRTGDTMRNRVVPSEQQAREWQPLHAEGKTERPQRRCRALGIRSLSLPMSHQRSLQSAAVVKEREKMKQ